MSDGKGKKKAARKFILALAERIHAQSELLSKKAERKMGIGETGYYMQLEAEEKAKKRSAAVVLGVGKDAPTVTNAVGAKQSATIHRADLFPPLAFLGVSKVLAEGAEKHGEKNWRGIPVDDHLNHALIHIMAMMAGDEQDDHMGHAACRMMMAYEMWIVKAGGNE
jgi:hypothetical protein